MAALRLPSRAQQEDMGEQQGHSRPEKPGLDPLGIFVLGIIIGAFSLLCRSVEEPFLETPAMVAVSAILLLAGVLFALNEKFWTKDPLLPFWLLKTNGIGITFVGQICISQTEGTFPL